MANPMTTSQDKTVAQVLREAKALIDTPSKWGTGPHIGGLCAIEAISRAAGDNHYGLYRNARGLFRHANNILGSVASWNDSSGRTHAEVMTAFDKANVLAEQAESAP